ncbi:MAG: GNAT family N-acetyltransferase [Mangrovibacterium sp.]
MNIRHAQKTDLPQIWELIMALAANEDALDKVELQENDVAEYLFGDFPCLFALVAEEHNKIQGIALYYYRVSTWVGKTLHLEDLVVSEQTRGKGIGSQLFKALAQVALDTNTRRIDWEVSIGNDKGKAFYAQLGANFEENWRICRMEHQAILDLCK